MIMNNNDSYNNNITSLTFVNNVFSHHAWMYFN